MSGPEYNSCHQWIIAVRTWSVQGIVAVMKTITANDCTESGRKVYRHWWCYRNDSSADTGGSSDGSSTASVVSVPDVGGESSWGWVVSVESRTLVVRVVGQ